MNRLCLDSNVLIQAKSGPYPFDLVPSFWQWLDDQFQAGTVYSSHFVFNELVKYDDDLADWVRERKTCFIEPDETVQKKYAEVVNYVQQNNKSQAEAQRFLAGADPWVIAEALATGHQIVTLEKRVPSNSSKIKIPNICEQLNGPVCVDTYQLMRILGAKL